MNKLLKIRTSLLCILLCVSVSTTLAQPFISAGMGGGIAKFRQPNQIIDNYHQNYPALLEKMDPLQAIGGVHAGVGSYMPKLSFEIQYSFEGFTRFSRGVEPSGQFFVRNIRMRYHYLSAILGVRPFESRYFTLGMSMNFGSWKTSFSNGNEFSEIARQFSPGNDIFVDFVLLAPSKIGLRVRPYYQFFYMPTELGAFETALTGTNGSGETRPSGFMNHFGVKITILYLLSPDFLSANRNSSGLPPSGPE